ncbi:sensor histidine kinase [Saccharibacillus alkalitolerans]|uniref:histidine kinase n=1 Tax=Saccharibacillus alkalitolerans TaxID=2705290 RepID=A0ABX0F672_9BACL|nr:HAMP domain-containing sensor histidine kinase [Saccharibacillus alkalitolerans]NGZ76461.1 HAMP domain-containing histidine kinase [Saccharibacillus alkalitolerans]
MANLWWIFLLPTLVLLGLYIGEKLRVRKMRRDLAYMNGKLAAFANPDYVPGPERLLVVTGESELRELLGSINRVIERAAQASASHARTEQAMRRMLANVSHDLKTPLTVVMGYAEVLDRSSDLSEEERRAMLGQVYRKTVEVHERINAFFDLSKLESDDYDLPLTMVDAAELCRQRILGYFDLLQDRGFRVDIDLPERPARIYANAEALDRILDNLLSNAIRYGSDGAYLGLHLTESEESVRIEVTDRGRGIPASEQLRVFERMYTLENSRNRGFQGSGLGLAIVKRLTERLGGSVTLASEPGVRTAFTLTFPSSPKAHVSERKK